MTRPALAAAAAGAALVAGLAVAQPTGAAPPGHTAFALVVTNNHGAALGRPDLQYADDDGARYYELFATLAPADHIALLTEFDRDTARLFPGLVALASPPSRARVADAARGLAAQVAAAERAGEVVDFYFVFAGHGDVEHGRGFLQLTDGAFDAADLEALVRAIHATRSHIILDSCNSFFVVNPRRPGGHRFATPADAAAGLAERLPGVGVFVSTSAEAEVFEWSALQSGVFSHAVRSGLAGAADANHDGAISYDELRAFVDTATAEIKNSAFRPKVYARGPGGDDQAAIAAAGDGGLRLTLDTARAIRLTIRDRDELPRIDLYKEAGTPLTLRLPAAAASADERDPRGVVQRRELPEAAPALLAPARAHAQAQGLAPEPGPAQRLPQMPEPAQARAPGPGLSPGVEPTPPATAELDDLPLVPPSTASRAADEPFRGLFARPFGPAALARYDAERAAEPPPVFGIARDDVARLGQLLDEVDGAQRQQRHIAAAYSLALGAFELTSATLMSGSLGQRAVPLGLGALFTALGLYQLSRPWPAEHLRDALLRGLAAGRDPARVVAEIDDQLHAASQALHRGRMLQRWIGFGLVAFAVGAYATDRALDHRFSNQATAFDPLLAATGVLGAIRFVDSFGDLPIERTVRLWDHEPSLAGSARFAVVPTQGGAAVALGGKF